jgi:hypothetical protein
MNHVNQFNEGKTMLQKILCEEVTNYSRLFA